MDQFNVEVISNGIAYGKCVNVENNYVISDLLCSNTTLEISQFQKAVNSVISDLTLLQNSKIYDEQFIDVHIMILKDPTLNNAVYELINEKRYQASKAFTIVIDKYIDMFNESNSFYMQERNLDLKDIKNRVLKKLNHHYFKDYVFDKIILVCEELYPSLLMEYKDSVAGVIAKKGGQTSHGAILCKAREIPYVLLKNHNFKEDINLVIDTRKQLVYSEVDDKTLNEYKTLKKKIKHDKPIDDFSKYKIKVLANVSSNQDLDKVLKYNLYGVGLYRTEFIFMNKDKPLDYQEQVDIYTEAVEKLNGKVVCFRTFDIGDDKQISYINASSKGVHNYRNNRELFQNQVKALIASNKYSNIKIMFPMIRSYEEFKYLRDWVYKIKLKMQDTSFIKVGMMLETKEALMHLDDFKDIDFMSLGTNDLTAELYQIKRDEVLHYDSFIRDLISRLRKVQEHCKKYNIELSICGELAGVSDVVKMLYQIGIKQYSVSASNVKTLELALKDILTSK